MDITINGTSQKVKILQLLPVDPDQAWKAIFTNSDFVFGEGTKDDFRALPIIIRESTLKRKRAHLDSNEGWW